MYSNPLRIDKLLRKFVVERTKNGVVKQKRALRNQEGLTKITRQHHDALPGATMVFEWSLRLSDFFVSPKGGRFINARRHMRMCFLVAGHGPTLHASMPKALVEFVFCVRFPVTGKFYPYLFWLPPPPQLPPNKTVCCKR